MPKYGIHSIVLHEAIDKLAQHPSQAARAAAATMQAHPDAAALGAVGPDLFFFAPDYPAMQGIIALHQNFKGVIDVWDSITDKVDAIKGAFMEVKGTVDEAVGDDQVAMIDMVLKQLRATTDMFMPLVRTGLMAGVVDGVNDLFSQSGVTATQHFFDKLFTPGLQKNEPVGKWFWFDLLHYRRTGRFAKRLVTNAMTPRARAYALGYLSHVATDVTGHAYVNQIVGAPYRRNVQRHVTAENFMDTWAFDNHFGESVSSTLLTRMGLQKDTCTPDIAGLLATSMQQAYGVAPMWPSNQAKAFLSPTEITQTYEAFHFILRVMEGMGIERPAEPFAGVWDVLEKAWQDVVQPPPAPPSTPSANCTWQDMLGMTANSAACYQSLFDNVGEWLAYLGKLGAWLAERVKELLDFLISALLALPVAVLLGLLYAVQLACYQLYRMAHWSLSSQGLVFPLRDDLNNGVAARLVRADMSCMGRIPVDAQFGASAATRYPKLMELGDSHLVCPVRGSESDNRLWNFVTNAAPFDPRQFMEALPFSEANVLAYAQAVTPAATFALEKQGKSMGNAVDLTTWMVATAAANVPGAATNACFADWNLDSDRGYGYRTWSGDVDVAVKGQVTNEALV